MSNVGELLLGTAPDRDYTVAGPEADHARDEGLVDGEWFVPPIDPDRLQELSQREYRRPLGHYAIYVAVVVGLGAAAVVVATTAGWAWAIPVWILYFGVYGGSADARWHEFGHGTATPSARVNSLVYAVSSFQTLRNPTHWQWSHFRHHSDTIVVGRDPEIQLGRPGTIRRWLFNYTGLKQGPLLFWTTVRFAFDRLDPSIRDYVPESERRLAIRQARIALAIHVLPFALAIVLRSPFPILLFGVVPSTLGVWGMVFFGVTQHLGLAEDVLDHRENTRTAYMNPVFRFLYLNMNYHVEHHIFPTVPYYHLPAIHDEVRESLPPATPSTWRAYREIFRSLRAQRFDPDDVVPDRPIPDVESTAGALATIGWSRPNGTDDLGPLDRYPVGSVARVDVGDRTYAVARVSDDEVCVLDGICTHGQAHLGGGALVDADDGPQIQCPKHLGRFDVRTGAPCSKPVSVAMAVHEVSVEDGHVIAAPESTSVATEPTSNTVSEEVA